MISIFMPIWKFFRHNGDLTYNEGCWFDGKHVYACKSLKESEMRIGALIKGTSASTWFPRTQNDPVTRPLLYDWLSHRVSQWHNCPNIVEYIEWRKASYFMLCIHASAISSQFTLFFKKKSIFFAFDRLMFCVILSERNLFIKLLET